jgi:hypothetical protein
MRDDMYEAYLVRVWREDEGQAWRAQVVPLGASARSEGRFFHDPAQLSVYWLQEMEIE